MKTYSFISKKPIKLKDGTSFNANSRFEVNGFLSNSLKVMLAKHIDTDREFKLSVAGYLYMVSKKAPSITTMRSWESDGIAKSVFGKRVELDGMDEYGSPSWFLVMGLI
jgi:hypothetical protein